MQDELIDEYEEIQTYGDVEAVLRNEQAEANLKRLSMFYARLTFAINFVTTVAYL